MEKLTKRGISGDITPRARVRRPIPSTPAPLPPLRRSAPSPTPSQPQARSKSTSRAKTRWLFGLLQYPLIAAIALGAAYSSTIGQVIVIVYAIGALVLRRSSRLSFGIALFLLLTIPLFQLLGQSGIAENAAIYVYELLVIGTAQAVIELRKTVRVSN